MKAFTITSVDIAKCPKHSFLPSHYRDDGTCRCGEVKELKRQLRELRKEMRAAGIKKTSPFNGGLDMETYRYNARRFELETKIKSEES